MGYQVCVRGNLEQIKSLTTLGWALQFPKTNWGIPMPIYALLQGRAFEAEQCQAMGLAFETLLEELGLKDRNDPLCELVAKKIIELGERGERDPQRLFQLALADIRP
ncbi:MAG TPA: hypothetical protein VGL34_15550 [Steroidobacteraceae bacterium]